MSSIFERVDENSARRKMRVLDISTGHNIFVPPPSALTLNVKGVDDGMVDTSQSGNIPLCIDLLWVMCVACALGPTISFMYNIVSSNVVSRNMTGIPYDCSMFYMGLFVALPGASVYVFCCTLMFYRRGKVGILLCMASIFIFVCSVEQSCMNRFKVDSSLDFYMLSASVITGVVSQIFFCLISSITDERKHMCIALLGVAGVMVVLSVLAVALAGTTFDERYSKASCYITSVPISIGLVIYILSTYSTLSPVRVLCQNM